MYLLKSQTRLVSVIKQFILNIISFLAYFFPTILHKCWHSILLYDHFSLFSTVWPLRFVFLLSNISKCWQLTLLSKHLCLLHFTWSTTYRHPHLGITTTNKDINTKGIQAQFPIRGHKKALIIRVCLTTNKE